MLDERSVRFLVTLVGLEARGRRIVVPAADVDIPKVRQFGQHLHHLAPLDVRAQSVGASQLVGGEAKRDRALVTDGVLDVLQNFARQAHPVR